MTRTKAIITIIPVFLLSLISMFIAWLYYYNTVAIILAKMQDINVTIFLYNYSWNTNPVNVDFVGVLAWIIMLATLLMTFNLLHKIKYSP